MGHDDVPGDRGADDEGADGARAVDDEDQGDRAAGAEVLSLDWRVDPVVAVDVPADVDLEAGVRRERADHRAPQVLLRSYGWPKTRGWIARRVCTGPGILHPGMCT